MHDADKPNIFAVYSVALLQHGERYLLLQRAATKRFAPGRWTGIGGAVEPEELHDLRAAALREVQEETGITERDIDGFTLRRALLHARLGGPLTALLYFTGALRTWTLPPCSEGTLAWVTPEHMHALDIIENTRAVLPLLIADQQRDPHGQEPVKLGAAVLDHVVWV